MGTGMGWSVSILLVCLGMVLGSLLQRRMTQTSAKEESSSEMPPLEESPPKVWTADSIVQFAYDLQLDEIQFSGAFSSFMGDRTRFTHASELFRTSHVLHEGDREPFFRLLDSCKQEDGWVEDTLRFSMEEGQYSWLELRMHRCGSVISGTLVNMAQWKDEVERWKEKAARDTLTGLYNREFFERTVRAQLREASCESGAMIFLDVDDFKRINDTQGHPFGDEVLCWVAEQIQCAFRHTDVITRYGGDEFLIFAPNLCQPVLEERLEQLCAAFHKTWEDQSLACKVTGSIGAAIYPRDGEDYESLLNHADCALYAAKAQGKNRFLLYQSHMRESRT